MRKIIFFLYIFLNFTTSFSQQVHVRYKNVRSPIVSVYEDLYINRKNQVISIQDSILIYAPSPSSEISVLSKPRSNSAPSKISYISDINTESKEKRNFFFNSYIGGKFFFVFDEVIRPEWIIDYSEMTKIAGYKCIKATTRYRGTEIEAYFTKDLPYDAGPFKFYGLPGLILFVKEKGNSFNIWKAESVDLNDKKVLEFKPKFPNFEKIGIKEFVEKRDEKFNNVSQINNGVKIKVSSQKQMSIEKIYEWEK
ncbi:MAG TPA: hypothetical protein DIT47_09835 [Flavobacteriaceae bacterium]|nr:hypothetical protein [Flavobacteriaceae bacterium]